MEVPLKYLNYLIKYLVEDQIIMEITERFRSFRKTCDSDQK